MLVELRVENLGVIEELGLVLGPGMTVLTGETGAGKTLLVDAIELLVGARADATLVRSGAAEARAEARFVLDEARVRSLADVDGAQLSDDEIVLARVVPADGRSRAYLNGRLVPAGVLSEVGGRLLELHGQQTHQSLLAPASHREALDRFAGPAAARALGAYRTARDAVRELDEGLAAVGGDARERAREMDLLRYQVEEIEQAGIASPDEEDDLAAQEQVLADAAGHREAAHAAHAALEGPALDGLGEAVAAVGGRPPFAAVGERLAVLQDEAAALARELRSVGESIEDDPDRLEAVRVRRRLLVELRRKYGDTLGEVLEHRDTASRRLQELEDAEVTAAQLGERRAEALATAVRAAEELSEVRRSAASRLAEALEAELHELAMPSARVEVAVRSHPERLPELPSVGVDDVELLLSANVGEPPRSLARVASGGELARTMLAARMVLTEAPPTLVFDEVDAGIGGQAGVAVGRKLAVLAAGHQVVCVTHLAQVAAFADAQVVVGKEESAGRTVARARPVDGADRVAELSRMLAGSGSARARDHAEELLLTASRERGR